MNYGNLFIGCSGWYYEDWKGFFYPEKLQKKDWLKFYSQKFNTVEVNSSFYRMPQKKTLKNWYDKTPENFIFSLKAFRGITHIKTIGSNVETIRNFYKIAENLREKLGPILFQFPSSFKKDFKTLESLIKNLDLSKNNVFEFRDKTWFNRETISFLKENGIGFCITSAPDLPLIIETTSKFSYIRWHGKRVWYGDLYSRKDIEEWGERIKSLLKRGDVFGYFNNDFSAFAVKNALELKMEVKGIEK